MYLSGKRKLFKTRTSKYGTTTEISVKRVIIKTAFILATIINTKIAKIKASFLAFGTVDT